MEAKLKVTQEQFDRLMRDLNTRSAEEIGAEFKNAQSSYGTMLGRCPELPRMVDGAALHAVACLDKGIMHILEVTIRAAFQYGYEYGEAERLALKVEETLRS